MPTTFLSTQDPQNSVLNGKPAWPMTTGVIPPPCPAPTLPHQMKIWQAFLTSSNCLLLLRLRWEGWMKVCKATTPYSKWDHQCTVSIISQTTLNNPFQGFIRSRGETTVCFFRKLIHPKSCSRNCIKFHYKLFTLCIRKSPVKTQTNVTFKQRYWRQLLLGFFTIIYGSASDGTQHWATIVP